MNNIITIYASWLAVYYLYKFELYFLLVVAHWVI